MKRKYLVAVVGPTALGKTKLAIALATHYNSAVVSADSRQFFKELSIGTAVPGPRELGAVPHHFIQHISIHDAYSVGDFEKDSLAVLHQLFDHHDIIILVGGSGLYIRAVTEGLDTFPPVSPSVRENLNDRFKKKGLATLQDQLRELDPAYFARVDLQNPQRIIRALEVCISSGSPYSSFLTGTRGNRPFELVTLGLDAPREILYERINRRVDEMMAQGLLDEAMGLLEYRNLNALRTVGYKELFGYLEGSLSLEEAVAEIKKNTRRFAKRQLTWFRKQENIHWIDYLEPSADIINRLNALIDEREAEA